MTSAPIAPAATHPRPAPPRHPRATTSLVLGIVSVAGVVVLIVPVLAAPLAWYFGATARRDVDREPWRWSGRGPATAGMILGMIGTALLLLALLVLAAAAGSMVLLSRFGGAYAT